MSVLDLAKQVINVLSKRNGGTGNPNGWGSAVVVVAQNSSASVLPLGSVVKYTRTLGQVVLAQAGDLVAGVVVGTYANGDGSTYVESDVAAGGLAAVMTLGQCRVLIDSNVAALAYATVSAVDGYAESTATDGAAVFGQFMTNGVQATLDLVPMYVAPALNLPPAPPTPPPDISAGECEFHTHLPSEQQLSRWSRIPADCTVTGWSIVADTTGTIEIDIWVTAYGSAPPGGSGDSITGSAPPGLTAAQRNTSTTLTGWTTALTEGDWIRFSVTTATNEELTDVVLAMHVTKTS